MKMQTVLKTVTSIAIMLTFAIASYSKSVASPRVASSTVIGMEMIPNTSDRQFNFELAAKGGQVGRLLSEDSGQVV